MLIVTASDSDTTAAEGSASGFIGFSRTISSYSTTTPDGELFYSYLYSTGATDSDVFSLFLGETTEQSFIEIGGSDVDTYSSDSTGAVTLTLTSNYYWLMVTTGFRIGASDDTYAFKYSTYVIFDSAIEYIYIPKIIGSYISR